MNRKVIVTGAATGLGAAIAEKFAAQGAGVLMVDIHPEIAELAKKLQGDGHGLRCDLGEAGCGEKIFEEARARLGGCDLLVNNAAWSLHVPFLKTKIEDFDRLIAINQRSPFLLTQAFVRALDDMDEKPADPCVIHISSVNAVSGNLNLVAYSGTKGALEAMTRSMAVELAPRGIRVNAVRPGVIDTDNYRDAMARKDLDPATFWPNFLIKHPIPPGEIADAVAFLCGSSGRSITGTIWTIDGGYSAR